MKSLGIVRKIDELGRIVLPIEIRKTMGIENRDAIEIFVDEDKIVLKKYQPACIFCGTLGSKPTLDNTQPALTPSDNTLRCSPTCAWSACAKTTAIRRRIGLSIRFCPACRLEGQGCAYRKIDISALTIICGSIY